MSKPSIEAVLAANATFYRAFTAGDFATMRELWAKRAPIACFHPGLPMITGRDQVLEAWRQILLESAPIVMRCDAAEVQLFGQAALVLCYEGNSNLPAHLAATNVFVLEDAQWRMVHHHAGPLARPIAVATTSGEMN